MLEEIKTASIFKGAEWIAEMNSSEIIDKMKDMSYLSRNKGGRNSKTEIITVQRKGYNGRYDYKLRQVVSKEIIGTNMSNHRPTIDGIEYVWADLRRLPKELLQVKLYRYWLEKESDSDE